MYSVGQIYYDHNYDVVFTVTDARYHADMELWAVVRADLDYPCYGQNERIFTVDALGQIKYEHEFLAGGPDLLRAASRPAPITARARRNA